MVYTPMQWECWALSVSAGISFLARINIANCELQKGSKTKQNETDGTSFT